MDEKNENIEPLTDLGLALGYSNQCIQSRLNSDLGAGANAGSVLGMTFVATEPLSELVWCAEKGPSNVTLSPPQSNTGGRSAAEKPIDEENFINSDTSFCVKGEVSGKEDLTTSPKSDAGIMLAHALSQECETETIAGKEEVKTPGEVSIWHKQVDTCSPINFEVGEIREMPESGEILHTTLPGDVDRDRANVMKADQIIPFLVQGEPFLGELVRENKHADDGNPNKEIEFLLTSKAYLVNASKHSGALVVDQNFQGRSPLDKLESTADHDVQKLRSENACSKESQKVAAEFLLGLKESSKHVEELLPNPYTSKKRQGKNFI
ncbi:uncharacterized protein LOC126790898 [Argentina anserina]|uniref:uncharacterized protein LOC126790898 n=1 Tax=Argentina anserina TaxID=57926 RepID=UPI0021761E44|nr:uncharacterized protein LOC126790898 [Potentilla anserina]